MNKGRGRGLSALIHEENRDNHDDYHFEGYSDNRDLVNRLHPTSGHHIRRGSGVQAGRLQTPF